MIILALDQATKISGFSVWKDGELSDFGRFEVKNNDTIERMRCVYDNVEALVDKYNPDIVAIEAVQYQQNQKVYSVLSQLQGVLFSLFFGRGIDFTIIEPAKWKASAGINTRAKRDEQKIESMIIVEERYGKSVTDDESDAILMGCFACNTIKGEKGE